MKILLFLLLPFLAASQINLSFSKIDPTCAGNSNGSIFLSVAGGIPPYGFQWSNGKTSRNINLLPAGTYSVIVIDLQGTQATGSATLTEPLPLTLAYTNNTAGTVIISASGGTPPYQYQYKTGATYSPPQPHGLFLLPAGTYNFKATDSKNCQKNLVKKTI